MRFQLWSLLLVLVMAGCGAAATASGGGNPDRITSELLREADPEGLNVYEIIQRNRSRWLRAGRGDTSFGNVTGGSEGSDFARVVLDGAPYGDISNLRSLDTDAGREYRVLGLFRRHDTIRDRLHGWGHPRPYARAVKMSDLPLPAGCRSASQQCLGRLVGVWPNELDG